MRLTTATANALRRELEGDPEARTAALVRLAADEETRRGLRQLSGLWGVTMQEALKRIVAAALAVDWEEGGE